MGVKGLTKYIFKFEKSVVEPIDIRTEIENWIINHAGKGKPKILIDLKEFMHIVVQRDEIGMILGGRFDLYNQIIKRFLDSLVKANAQLVLFQAGYKANDDLPLYIPKHERNYADRLEVLDEIEKGSNLKAYLDAKHKLVRLNDTKRVSSAFEWNMSRLVRTFGEMHVTFVRHNQEIAQYAQEHADEVLAIITNDTSFLAFEGEYQYWHSNRIDLREMAGIRLNRQKLLEILDINVQQLQLIGALSGEMFLPYTQLGDFLAKLSADLPESVRGKIFVLQTYVKRQPAIEIKERNKVPFKLEPIASDVFGKDYSQMELNAIYNGLMLFQTNFRVDAEKHPNSFVNFCKIHCPFMYFLITNEVYVVKDIEYLDYRNVKSKNYAQLIVPMLMKLCGILFKDDSPRRPTRKICMKYAHDEPAKVVNENIIYPEGRWPPLFDLVFKYNEQVHMKQRWAALAWVLDFDDTFIELICSKENIDRYLAAIFAAKFLLQHEEITANEANVIIFTERQQRNSSNNNGKIDYPAYPNIRHVRTCHLYVYVYKWINHCLDVCGLHNKTDLIKFDGPKYHSNMEKYDVSNETQVAGIKTIIESIHCF